MKRTFYRLLSIDPKSNAMLLLFLPPVYALWLMAVSAALERKLKRSLLLLDVAALLEGLLMTFVWIMFCIPRAAGQLSHAPPFAVAIVATVLLRLILVPALFARFTVKADRTSNPDYYFTIVNFRDYIYRFFAFCYKPYTLWALQRMVAAPLKEELR